MKFEIILGKSERNKGFLRLNTNKTEIVMRSGGLDNTIIAAGTDPIMRYRKNDGQSKCRCDMGRLESAKST
jgi:hypothetical protein